MRASASRNTRLVRAILMLVLLGGELLHFGVPLIPRLNPTLHGWWWPVIQQGRLVGEAALGAAFVTIFLSWPVFRAEIRLGLLHGRMATLNRWLGVHLLGVALTVGWLALGTAGENFGGSLGLLWVLGGAIVLPATALAWCLAAIPSDSWMGWLSACPGAAAAGAGAGLLTCASGYLVELLWPPLTYYTFVCSGVMLRVLGFAVISDPAAALLGTKDFSVQIAPGCSGLEGIALIAAFMTAYLWFYRADYRFPAALLMIPTGIAVIWMLNAVRITALIVIGQWSSTIAVTGFHSVAGWIFFNLTAFGLVSMSHRASWLIRDDALSDSARDTANPATPYLAPLLATIAVAMLTAAFSSGFEAAYPLQVLITGLALWWYRDRIGATLINFSWTGVTIGALCFGIWVLLARPDHASNLAFGAHLKSLPSWMLGGWVIARIAGAVITVPLAEELAFRGYLQRKLIAPDFIAVPFDQFTWASFAITSTAFGLLHQSWIAGICAGMLFAFAVYRRGRLADAILAHAVANALLAAYILTTGNWSLWL